MVYLHIPFCKSFCTYCGFYSELGCGEEAFSRYAEEVIAEASRRSDEIRQSRLGADTLYIGGGTPSVLPLELLGRIVEAIETAAGVRRGEWEEFTIEVNPEDIVERGEAYVLGLKELGISRISMGVQSFDDGILRWMNRRHNASGARKAYRMLESAGLRNISIDLIFGIGGMDMATWQSSVESALHIGNEGPPAHISAYQLSIEEDSALFAAREKGHYQDAGEEECRRQYDWLCQRLHEAGYQHYEVSNFCLPGHRAVHNSAYWKRLPYVGLGPGAHSLCGDVRSWNSGSLRNWQSASEQLNAEDIRLERLMLALRTAEGLREATLRTLCPSAVIDRLLASGSLIRTYASAEADNAFAETADFAGAADASAIASSIRIPESNFFISDEIIATLA